jgi:type I restriction enzyme S subunit
MSSVVPDGWISSQLGSLGVFSKGKGISKKETLPDGIPCIRYAEIYTVYDFRIKTFKSFISPITAKTSKKLRKNDIIFAGSGETVEDIGKSVAFTLDCDAYVGGDSIVLSPSSDLDSTFLSYQLNDTIRRSQLRKLGQGSSVIHIYSSGLQEVTLSIPPLPEQKKIASILTSVDEVIENTQKQIDKLQDLKKATMNELLTKGIGHTEFKDSELGRIPKSWEVMRMRSIAQVIDSLHETPTFSDFGIPMVRVTDIKRGDLSVDNAKTVSEEDYRKFIKKYEPQLGDIVMSRVGSYGVSSYVSSDKPFCMGQNTVIINPVDISGRFLYECLESDCIQRQIELEVAGSGYKSLSLADIRALAIPVPPMHEQERIRGLLLSIDGQVIVQKQKLSQTQSLKKSLMQDLLTGKVRVTVN